jgi:hypothetical protein
MGALSNPQGEPRTPSPEELAVVYQFMGGLQPANGYTPYGENQLQYGLGKGPRGAGYPPVSSFYDPARRQQNLPTMLWKHGTWQAPYRSAQDQRRAEDDKALNWMADWNRQVQESGYDLPPFVPPSIESFSRQPTPNADLNLPLTPTSMGPSSVLDTSSYPQYPPLGRAYELKPEGGMRGYPLQGYQRNDLAGTAPVEVSTSPYKSPNAREANMYANPPDKRSNFSKFIDALSFWN